MPRRDGVVQFAQASTRRSVQAEIANFDEQSQAELVRSLSSLTGKSVELQIAEEPELLGGVLVEVGDFRLDATTRGRLGELHDAVASGHLYESSLNRND